MKIEDNAKYELEHIVYELKIISSENSSSAGDITKNDLLRDDHDVPLFYEIMKDLLLDF